MIIGLIRTCPKDDYIARLCYESAKRLGFIDKFIFLCESGGEYKYSKEVWEDVIYHEPVSNYGGQAGARNLYASWKGIKMNDNDILLTIDSDIVFLDNPFKYLNEFDFAGVGGFVNGFTHISGQCMILKGWVKNIICAYPYEQITEFVAQMVEQKKDVADDTLTSYITEQPLYKKILLNNLGVWVHHKYYEYEYRQDWETIIKEINDTKAQ